MSATVPERPEGPVTLQLARALMRNHFKKTAILASTAAVLLVVGLLTAQLVLAQSGEAGACATGGAVPDPADNPGLVSDCEALLVSRDALAGAATLNWSAYSPIGEWEGVVLGRDAEAGHGVASPRQRTDGHNPGPTWQPVQTLRCYIYLPIG